MLAFDHIDRTTACFRRGLMAVGARLGFDGNFIAAVIANESGFRPEATNPTGGATGLIQFMPSTARRLGTTTDALRAMTAEEQLPFIEAYYRPLASRIHSPTDAYMATFLPAFVGKPADFVLATDPEIVYVQNRGFDHAQKGFITVGDVGQNAENATARARTRPPTDDTADDCGSPSSSFPPTEPSGWSFLAKLLALLGIGGAAYYFTMAKERRRRR